MLKRELKVNRKSLIIWTSILVLMFLLVYLIYPSMLNSDNAKIMDQMMATMPKEMLKAFNMDIADINTVFGWFKTEGMTYLLLIGGLYSAILASNILIKEEDEKTIEFLATKPISRNSIITSKVLAGLINITIMTVVVCIFNIIGMSLSNCLELKLLLILSLSPLIPFYTIYCFVFMITTLFKKVKQTMVVAIGFVFLSYILQIVSAITDKVTFIKYFSVFTLAETRYIISNNCINYVALGIALLIILVSLVVTYKIYNQKELV